MFEVGLLKELFGNEFAEIKPNTEQIPLYYGDRFIPRRYPNPNSLSSMFNRHIMNQQKENIDFIRSRQEAGYWRTKNYSESLKNALGMEQARMYQLSDPVLKSAHERFFDLDRGKVIIKKAYPNSQGFDWPCNPRVKPLAYLNSTHDLPGYGSNFGPNVISWSAKGPMAASFKNDLVLWTPDTLHTLIYKLSETKAIAYNPNGNVLAVSVKKAGSTVALQLWNCVELNFICHMSEKTSQKPLYEIGCIDWEPNGKHIACGTVGGFVLIFVARNLALKHRLKELRKKIFMVKFSPKSNYLAANDMSGQTVIWCWESCVVHCVISSKTAFNSVMDWHPWNGTDLAIASTYTAEIYIYNVPSKKIVAHYLRKDNLVVIEALLFSKISAELLVSCSIRNNGRAQYEVLVLASLDRIVDIMKSHEDSISFLGWSPNGMQLVSASDDDVLFLWDFFGMKDSTQFRRKKDKKKTQKLRLSILNTFSTNFIR